MVHFASFLRCAALGLLAFAIACGGAQTDDGTTPDGDGGGKAAPGVAQTFSKYEPITLQGMRFVPEALGRPGMPKVTPDKKTSIKALRKKMKKKHTQIDAQVLASMLWQDAAKAKDGAKLKNEALAILKKERETHGDKSDSVTLQMLAAAEAWAGNTDAWTELYAELVSRFGEEEGAPTWKAWLAYLYMKGDKNDEATALVDGWTPEKAGPIGSYSLAWVRMRQGKLADAKAALLFTAENWPGGKLSGALQRDLLLFLSRTGASVEEADGIIQKVAGDNRAQMLVQLSNGYEFAGHYTHASKTLDLIMSEVLTGENLPPRAKVTYLFRQGLYAFRLDNPGPAANHLMEAHKALAACTDCPDAEKQVVTQRLSQVAIYYHNTFYQTQDERFYKPAIALYDYQAGLGVEEAKTGKTNLEQTKKNAQPGTGKHDAEGVHALTLSRREGPQACYERALMSNPAATGSVTIDIKVSHDGKTDADVKDAGDLAAVGACMTEMISGWSYPRRTTPGVTTMTVKYNFEPRPAG